MDFTSDNICGVSEEILRSLALANEAETAAPYGADVMSMTLNAKFTEIFKRPAIVFPVVTGTAANALALSACVRPWEAILTHEKAHIEVMECGAPEFLSGGAKLIGVPGENGLLSVEDLERAVQHSGQGCLHRSQVAAISLTQSTDAGLFYTAEHLNEITTFAKDNGLYVHVDGARFANAVVAAGGDPAELVKGVDVLSFGATKNGALNAEAVVFFNEDLAKNFAFICKRAGHVVSKQRFLSAQLLSYLENDLWIKNATHANQAAQALADGLRGKNQVQLAVPAATNLVFLTVPAGLVAHLRAHGVGFYDEPTDQADVRKIRLVCGFSTPLNKIQAVIDLIGSYGCDELVTAA